MLRVTEIGLAQVGPELAAEWQTLLDASGADLSMGHEWFGSTVRARGIESRARVLTVRRDAALVGVLPCFERADTLLGVPLRTLECTGSYVVAYHPEIVTTEDRGAVLAAIAAHCKATRDCLVLPNLAIGSASWSAAQALAHERQVAAVARAGHASPFLSIAGSWDDYVAAKDKKFRYKVRNVLKQLEGAGRVHEEWFSAASEVERFLTLMLGIEDKSWKAGAGMAVSGSAMELDYHRRLLPFLAARNALRANVIFLDDAPVAYSLCYVWAGAFRQMKTSFDDRYAKLGAGSAVFQSAIRRAFAEGAREFDFLGDDMQHKAQWSTGVRQHETLALFLPTWRGALAARGRRLAQRLRASMRRAPTDAGAHDAGGHAT